MREEQWAPKIVRFPEHPLIGYLYTFDPDDPPGSAMQLLGEARGTVTVPAGKALCLRVSPGGFRGLSALAGLKADDLYALDLGDTLVSDAELADIAGLALLRGLTNLRLSSFRVTDRGLDHLRRLSHLRYLDLTGTSITGVGMARLQCLSDLLDLLLRGSDVTDAGLAHLRGLTDLQRLDLRNTKVSDVGLAHLGRLTSLRVLYLSDTGVSDVGLSYLSGLTSLQYLDVMFTAVSDAGVDRLRAALLGCQISAFWE